MNFSKRDLAKHIKKRLKEERGITMPVRDIVPILNLAFWGTRDLLNTIEPDRDQIIIKEFGMFIPRITPGRPVRNPHTNEPLYMPPRKVLKLKTSKGFFNGENGVDDIDHSGGEET